MKGQETANEHPPIYPDEHGDWAAANRARPPMISSSAEQIASRLVDVATDINGGVRLYALKTAIAQGLTAAQGEIAVQAERARCFREEREIVQAALEQAEAERARLREALTALTQLWRVKEKPGVFTELGLRAEHERGKCADAVDAVLSTPVRPSEET